MSLRPRLRLSTSSWSRIHDARQQAQLLSSVLHSHSSTTASSRAHPVAFPARGLASTANTSTSVPAATINTPHIHLPDLPTFRAKGTDIKVLYEPSEFYQFLLGRIKRAKKRIFLASLYIGKEETELVCAPAQPGMARSSLLL